MWPPRLMPAERKGAITVDGSHFDDLTRRFAEGASRRAFLASVLGGLAGLTRARANAQTRKPNGAACTRATDCASLKCVDGVCCNTACTGQCESCASGVCAPVSGAPVGSRPACPGSGPCRATCDGVTRTSCAALPGSETSCGASTCSGGFQTTYGCGGNGACHPTTTSCRLYVCNGAGTACLTTCASDADCVGAAHCAGGICQGDQPLGEACAGPDQCQSGFCVDGVCCISACSGACQSCNVPGNAGFCTEEADGSACAGGICCDGDCVDTASGPEHCGACDAACPIPQCRTATCAAGICGSQPNPARNGQMCNDGDPCTTGDTCQNGGCVGTPVSCPICQHCSGGQCIADPTQEGMTCGDDGNVCTNTVCRGGQCVNEQAVVCTTPPVCRTTPGTCIPQTGACAYPNAPNTTSCGTNRVCCNGVCCATGQTCVSGICQTPCLNQGDSCRETNQCCQVEPTMCVDNQNGFGATCCHPRRGSCNPNSPPQRQQCCENTDICQVSGGAGVCCVPGGRPCVSSGDCCFGTCCNGTCCGPLETCFNGACRPCRGAGASCGSSDECCSGQCIVGSGGARCQ